MYKRTKIVCTMGPACDSDETIREMIKAGMNVARFNFSHGSYDEHHGRIERVRRISKELGLPGSASCSTPRAPRSAPAFWSTARRLPSRPATRSSSPLSPRPRISTAPLGAHLPRLPGSALRGREGLPHPDR